MIYVETARLILRDWVEKDLEVFKQMNADKQVMTFFPKVLSSEETEQLYNVIRAEIVECGYGLFAAEVKHTNEFIGFIGFHQATFEADFTPCVEIGWRLKQEAWGKGYATEGAKACLEYGFLTLGLNDVYSFTADINDASKNVMKKIGVNFIKTFNHPKIDSSSPLQKHVLYHIGASQK